MPTCSADPDRLRGYALDLRSSVRRATPVVDAVARAHAAYVVACPDAVTVPPPPIGAHLALGEASDLALGVDRVGEAFAAADGHRGGRVVAADDLALTRGLLAEYPGMAEGALLEPEHYQRGRALGRRLARAGAEERLRLLVGVGATLSRDPHLAAGLWNGMGATGFQRVVDDVEDRYRNVRIDPVTAERTLVVLRDLFATAATTGAPMHRPGDEVTVTPYGLDLGIVSRLGRTPAGRGALRELTVGLPRLPTGALVVVADALLRGPSADLDGFPSSPNELLRARLGFQAEPVAELSILRALALDPLACVALEVRSPTGTSTTLAILGEHRTDTELVEVAAILRAVLVDSVHRGWLPRWTDPRSAAGRAFDDRPLHVLLDGLPQQISTLTHGPAVLRRTLADVVGVHAEFFVHRLHDEGGAGEALGHVGTDVECSYAFIGRDREALDRLTTGLLTHYGALARRSVAATPPARITDDALDRDLTWARDNLRGLENGAFQAGRTTNLYARIAITSTEFVAAKAAPTVVSRFGPTGLVVGRIASTVAGRTFAVGADRARDRWAEHNDRRDRATARRTDRAAVYLAAVAMVQDPRWSATLRFDPSTLSRHDLLDLDVGRSDGDQRRFRAWLAAQPDPVRRPLLELQPRD